jgi:hypothetical protein
MKPVLITIMALDKSTNQRVPVRVADGPNADVFGTSGLVWEPAITARPRLSIELMSLTMDGKVQAGQATFTIALDQILKVPNIKRLYWSGAPVVVYNTNILEGPTAVPDFSGYITSPKYDQDKHTIEITAEASTDFIDGPMLTLAFSGNGTTVPANGIQGEPGLRGTLMPAGFGSVKNIQPIWFDTTRNIGMIDGYGNTLTIDWLGEGLSSFGPRVADYPTYAALAAAIDGKAIKPGQWGTCVAQGLVGLGAPQSGIITVHATFGSNRLGAIMQRVLTIHRGVTVDRIDVAAFAAIDFAVPRPVHLWLAAQRSTKDLLEALAASCNATPLVTFQNKVSVTRAVSGAPVATLDRSGGVAPRVIDWQSGDVEPPYATITARAARPASVLSEDDVNYVDTIIDRGTYYADVVYRAGNTITLLDGSRWLYQNATPAAGHAPPVTAAADAAGNVQDAWWFRTVAPTKPVDANGNLLTTLISAAQQDATAALNDLARIGSDGWLNAGSEKREVVQDWQAIVNEQGPLDAQADAAGVSRTTFDNARMALSVYLNGLSPAWNDTTQDTAIVATTWNGKWTDYFYAKIALLNAISASAAKTSTWNGVTGPGKPADNATNSADPSSAYGSTTVDAFTKRVVSVETILGPGGSVPKQFADLQAQIDQAGGGDDDALVTRVDTLEASARGKGNSAPNLVLNPEFADGTYGSWTVGAGNWAIIGGYDVGPFLQSGNANAYIYQDINVSSGTAYSLSADMAPDQSGNCYVKIDWLDSSGRIISSSPSIYSASWARAYTADNAMTSPKNAAKARVYCCIANANSNGRFSRIQLQRGGVPTAYRNDGDAFYNASRLTSEVTLRTNQAGTYAQQFQGIASQFAGTQGSWLLSQFNTLSGTVSDNQKTLSQQVTTLKSTISALGSPNLLANGAFANGLTGWTVFNTSFYVVTDYATSASGIFAQSVGNGYSGMYADVSNIQQGKNYCFGFESDNDSGDNHCYICLRWYNSSGGQIGSDINGTSSSPGQNGWGPSYRINNGPYAAPSGAVRARVVIYLWGSSTGNKRLTRIQLQQSDQPTAYSDSASLQGLQAQVSQISGTLATVQGQLGAYFQVQASAGDATAFVSVKATVNGNSTSDVSIGAKEFLVYNDVNGQLLKTFVASGGNVQIFGNLAIDGSVTTRNLRDNSVSKRMILSSGSQVWTGDGAGGTYVPPAGGATGTGGDKYTGRSTA